MGIKMNSLEIMLLSMCYTYINFIPFIFIIFLLFAADYKVFFPKTKIYSKEERICIVVACTLLWPIVYACGVIYGIYNIVKKFKES
jgi:hypothetical protein